MKISFLIPAHNEEKIISKALDNLANLPYRDYEVLIGLDGCTDRTEEIVKKYTKKSKKFRYYSVNIRKGKPEVVDFLIQKAKGEIIFINDADWIFTYHNKEKLNKYLSVFKHSKVGGIAESFPADWQKDKIENGNIGLRMAAYSSLFWLQYQKKNFATKHGGMFFVDNGMFLTNVFRKKLYKKNTSLGDDFERTNEIKKQGYEVVLFDDPSYPRMITSYDKILVRDLFKQKMRTAIARRQLSKLYNNKIGKESISSGLYVLKESYKKDIYTGLIITYWSAITFLGEILSYFTVKNTEKGWALRAQR